MKTEQIKVSLNPCFVGMWSFSLSSHRKDCRTTVLILVLLGCGLLDGGWSMYEIQPESVLILVLLGCGLLVAFGKSLW